MRRLFLLTFTLLFIFSANTLKSQVLMDENFDYPAGDSLGAHGWVSFSGGSTNVLSVATPGLTYTGFPLSGIGNSCGVTTTGQDAYKQFANTDTSGSVYISFMVNVATGQTAGDYFFALLPDNSTSNYTGRVYVKDTTGGFKFGIAKATNPIVYGNSVYSYGTTYLVVVKFVFVAGASNDEVNLIVITGAIPGSEPAPTIGPVTQAIGDPANITRVAIRQGTAANAPELKIDGIRVSKSWGNLVAVNPVSTVAETFSLSQNYPNPFNPSTKVNFSIPEKGFVTLKVFDMLGKEVKELTHGDLSTGTYSVDFNAAGLSSGIYIYKMEVSTESGKYFTDTKKLSLIK